MTGPVHVLRHSLSIRVQVTASNTNYLELVVHRDADLEVMEDMRPINQDGSVTPILWMGNLTCSNRKQQAVIIP